MASYSVTTSILLLSALAGITAHNGYGYDTPPRPPHIYERDITVSGVRILNPCHTEAYKDAMELYWRTVFSIPGARNPANDTATGNNVGCPEACPEQVSVARQCGRKVTCPTVVPYLITGAWLTNGLVLERKCNITAGTPVIINIIDDSEFYAPGYDYYTTYNTANATRFPKPQPRLFPDSLVSLADGQARVNGTACFFAKINGVKVPNLFDFYHVSRYVPDMDISADSFKIQNNALFGGNISTTLTETGICGTDFVNAGHYLILPDGFPKAGTYNVEFGIHGTPECGQGTNQWVARGIETAHPYRCWPPAPNTPTATTSINHPGQPDCPGQVLDAATFQNLANLTVEFKYTIQVEPRKPWLEH